MDMDMDMVIWTRTHAAQVHARCTCSWELPVTSLIYGSMYLSTLRDANLEFLTRLTVRAPTVD